MRLVCLFWGCFFLLVWLRCGVLGSGSTETEVVLDGQHEEDPLIGKCKIARWFVRTKRKQVDPNDFSAEEIEDRVTMKHELVDPAHYHFSCIDGRYTRGVIGTPGGDLGEFLLAMNIYLKYGGILNRERIKQLYNDYLSDLSIYPLVFYMHTDDHSVEALKEELKIPNLDIRNVSKENQERVLEALKDPRFIGCGHIRSILQYPEEYETPKNLTELFLEAFFHHMWNEHQGVGIVISDYTILHGRHDEKAVLQVLEANSSILGMEPVDVLRQSAPQCNHFAPLVIPAIGKASMFIYHPDAVSRIRRNFAEFFAKEIGPIDDPLFLFEKANELARKHVDLTLKFLAPTKPIYTAQVMQMIDKQQYTSRTLRVIALVFFGIILGVVLMAVLGYHVYQKWFVKKPEEGNLLRPSPTETASLDPTSSAESQKNYATV